MKPYDILWMSVNNLFRRKTRTILAVVGVVVGTCAIVVMLSLGFGLSESYKAQIASYGNLHIIDVYPGYNSASMGNGMMVSINNNSSTLNDKSVAEISAIPGITSISPLINEYMKIVAGKYVADANLIGIKPDFAAKIHQNFQEGRGLLEGDKNSLVFGNQVPTFFFNPKKTYGSMWGGEPVVNVMTAKMFITGDYSYGQKKQQTDSNEKKINYKEYKVDAVGILENPGDETSYSVYMNFETLKNIQGELKKARGEINNGQNQNSYQQIKVYVEDLNKMEKVSQAIKDLGYSSYSLNDWLKQMQDTAKTIQAILGGIGAISLFVAAIGITNTMIMSTYERTKEIGVMKVLGANLKDIKNLFLLEAGVIGLLGGLIGLILSFLISVLMNNVLLNYIGPLLGIGGFGTRISVIPWWLYLASLVFSTAIGIIAGYFPANRAMKMSALESLKNE